MTIIFPQIIQSIGRTNKILDQLKANPKTRACLQPILGLFPNTPLLNVNNHKHGISPNTSFLQLAIYMTKNIKPFRKLMQENRTIFFFLLHVH